MIGACLACDQIRNCINGWLCLKIGVYLDRQYGETKYCERKGFIEQKDQ